MSETNERLRELVAQVASSYFSNSHVAPGEIPTILNQIASTLGAVGPSPVAEMISVEEVPAPTRPTPAQIRKSITHDALISFEDNRPYRTLRRHLAARGLTPEEYRAKWGLPDDYPLIAAAYSAKRSALALSIGLGQKRQPAKREISPAVKTRAAKAK
jgi:predicted transcriptional regulator